MKIKMIPTAPTPFDDKWPPTVVARGYSQVPNALIRSAGDLNLNPSEMLILLLLNAYDWGSKEVHPSQRTLSRQSGLSYSAVRANVVKLEQKGFIKRIAQEGTMNRIDMIPLVHKLVDHLVITPASKQAPPSLLANSPPPPLTGTEEDNTLIKQMNKTDRLNYVVEIKKDLYKNF